jgi:hypothetical protein
MPPFVSGLSERYREDNAKRFFCQAFSLHYRKIILDFLFLVSHITIMLTTLTYQKLKQSCKFCGKPRTDTKMLLCDECRKVYWREKSRESRLRKLKPKERAQ